MKIVPKIGFKIKPFPGTSKLPKLSMSALKHLLSISNENEASNFYKFL